MILGVKRSGESLNTAGAPGEMWTQTGRDRTAQELAELSASIHSGTAAVSGAIIVVGAGNGGLRGDLMTKGGIDATVADRLGMAGTVMNALVVAGDLRDLKVPHRLLLAEGIDFRMPGMTELEPCTPKALQACIEAGDLAIVGGGSGEYGFTTDSAIMRHLGRYSAVTGAHVQAVKATKVDGVYDRDPRQYADARLLSRVSAGVMREQGLTAVDSACLDLIEESGIEMRVHHMDQPLAVVAGGYVGTLIVAQPGIVEFASSHADVSLVTRL